VPVKISIIGASGRMGKLALSLIEQDPDLELHSALTSKNSIAESQGADLLLDLTKPEASVGIVDYAIQNNLRLVVGTSGWTKEKLEAVESKIKGSSATVTIIPNFSIGSVLATKFAAEAARYFDQIEITETHHPKKLDAPSGTALFTSQLISASRQGRSAAPVTEGNDAPVFNGIPITSLRIEGAHAEQEVLLAAPNESLYLKHVVSSHEVYSQGILLAIKKTMQLKGLTVGLLPLLEDK
jgi:4-hydroxy-tetrahydrodipicolinate reductase